MALHCIRARGQWLFFNPNRCVYSRFFLQNLLFMGGGGSIKKHTNEQKLFHITVCNCNNCIFLFLVRNICQSNNRIFRNSIRRRKISNNRPSYSNSQNNSLLVFAQFFLSIRLLVFKKIINKILEPRFILTNYSDLYFKEFANDPACQINKHHLHFYYPHDIFSVFFWKTLFIY